MSQKKDCEFQARQDIMAIDNRKRRLEATAQFYGVSQEEVKARARDVMVAILVGAFFEHLFNKPILDCKKAELTQLRESEKEFLEWRKKPTPSFAECLRVLDVIETRL